MESINFSVKFDRYGDDAGGMGLFPLGAPN
jgi:hypothetical protein